MASHSAPGHPPPGFPHRGASVGSHRRARRHLPRHVREEYRVARAAAVGAAGAVVVGAALGITGGALGGGGSSADTPSRTSLDEALQERANQPPSRGLARAESAAPTGVTLTLAQAPEARPVQASGGGVDSAPLPPVPESCEEYSGNQQIACSILPEFGFDLGEMPALVELWDHESGWNEAAYNEGSGACGIPQALPCSKMSTFGDDYETNPATQIRWGLDYIKNRYGTPTGAWDFWQANGWY